MWPMLLEKLREVLKAVAPLVAVVCLLQLTLVHAPLPIFVQFLVGSVLAIAGMTILFAGVEIGILPMGQYIGAELPKRGSLALIVFVAFLLGFATTVAEPDVLVLANQVDAASQGAISGGAVRYVIAVGLAAAFSLAMARIIYGWSMRYLLIAAYGIMLAITLVAPGQFVSLAYDAGSVTTGVLSAPVIIALAIGLSSVLAGRSAVSDGFGLLGFASIGPIIAILLLEMLRP
jgi:hypothetical protein